jgi:DNA-binding CsgD family transcriptional regulator
VSQDRADEAMAVLSELKEVAVMIDTRPMHGAVRSAEGIIQKAVEKYDAAKLLLEDAIDIYDAVNAPFEAARTRLELSDVLTTLGQFHLAEAELNKAMKIFQKLGAEKDVDKTRLQLKNLHKTNAESQAMNKKLEFTGRELEVLRLIAEGKNNEEIAGQLFLSVRTIEKHITNLYLKMGVSGKSARAFAASYAIRHHLVFS